MAFRVGFVGVSDAQITVAVPSRRSPSALQGCQIGALTHACLVTIHDRRTVRCCMHCVLSLRVTRFDVLREISAAAHLQASWLESGECAVSATYARSIRSLHTPAPSRPASCRIRWPPRSLGNNQTEGPYVSSFQKRQPSSRAW